MSNEKIGVLRGGFQLDLVPERVNFRFSSVTVERSYHRWTGYFWYKPEHKPEDTPYLGPHTTRHYDTLDEVFDSLVRGERV